MLLGADMGGASHCSSTSPVLTQAGKGHAQQTCLAGEYTRDRPGRAAGHRHWAFPGLPAETLVLNLHANEIFDVFSEAVKNQVEDDFSSMVQSLKIKQTLN